MSWLSHRLVYQQTRGPEDAEPNAVPRPLTVPAPSPRPRRTKTPSTVHMPSPASSTYDGSSCVVLAVLFPFAFPCTVVIRTRTQTGLCHRHCHRRPHCTHPPLNLLSLYAEHIRHPAQCSAAVSTAPGAGVVVGALAARVSAAVATATTASIAPTRTWTRTVQAAAAG
ncbi:hypothetical protein DFH08DRAFT_960078 [Mycena albidolilacea]|uniref:Uncharacterized protein n=1 Tax=Mycena albidolilacea TaxID=1033008 RepID=A0AAD7A4C9_9AGAR|nr:hypothetical protein DFH08DRAFT_960078 [Mycena albidolilacea]